MMKIKFLSLIALVLVFSCKGSKEMTNSNSDKLTSGDFQIQQIDGQDISDEELNLTFDMEEGTLSGYSGCNNFSADMKAEGTSLDLGHARATMRHCEDKMDIEHKLLSQLNEVVAYHYEDGVLKLLGKDGKTLLTTKYMEKKLKSGDYTITSIAGESVSNDKVSMSINAEEGQISGNTGCNTYGTSFKMNEDKLELNHTRVTKMYCKDAMELEKKFLQNLNKATSFNYQGKTLFFLSDEGHTVLTAQLK